MSKSGTRDLNSVFGAMFAALFGGLLAAIFVILVRTILVFMIVRSANVPVIQDWSFTQILGASAAVFILASNTRPRESETPEQRKNKKDVELVERTLNELKQKGDN